MTFDEKVRLCFALEVPNATWCQAQLGLKFGGLGFRSFPNMQLLLIASLSSSGFGSADDITFSTQ